MRTQVAIVGAGPAGLFLAHLLHRRGLDAIVLERHARAYVEGRVRAGVLEQGTVDLMERLGIAERMRHEGLVHNGINLGNAGTIFRIDLKALTGGKTVMVYGQQKVMRDLFDRAEELQLPVVFEAADVQPRDIGLALPYVTYRKDGLEHRVDCDFVIGCDGDHGVCRQCIPDDAIQHLERSYPFGWLGILADVPPANDELIYSNHERGFALASMRSPSRSRYYLQCSLDENIEDWPDERFWDELCVRLGPEVERSVTRGPSFEKSIAPLRSSVTVPMQYGRLFLAGDAAHIVPPTGAKGLNLAVSDVVLLSDALSEYYAKGTKMGLDAYSERALACIWKAERFSWWFTNLTHRFLETDGFARQMQLAEIAYIRQSQAAQAMLAENYVGLPLDRS